MKLVRISTLLAISAACVSGMMLFKTSQNVQEAEYRYDQLSAQRAKEQESARVLRAEWDYLNRPDRLETLATEQLGMVRPDAQNMLEGASLLPNPFVPVIPPRKPSQLQHAAFPQDGFKAVTSPASPPASASSPKPEITQEDRNTSRESFQDLISTLSEDGEGNR